MKFETTGIDFDSLVNLIVYRDDFVKFLLDVQNGWRIRRAMQEDEGDRLLAATRAVDEIIAKLDMLEEVRAEYVRAKEEEERKKREEEAENSGK